MPYYTTNIFVSISTLIYFKDRWSGYQRCYHKMFTDFPDEQYELLKSSKQEQESILQRLNAAEQHCKETEVSVLRFL